MNDFWSARWWTTLWYKQNDVFGCVVLSWSRKFTSQINYTNEIIPSASIQSLKIRRYNSLLRGQTNSRSYLFCLRYQTHIFSSVVFFFVRFDFLSFFSRSLCGPHAETKIDFYLHNFWSRLCFANKKKEWEWERD